MLLTKVTKSYFYMTFQCVYKGKLNIRWKDDYVTSKMFSGRCTGESLLLRVDFIHRVEFEEVSGHRVLIKRGPGNRGASPRGSTHEATSGMSS